MNFRFLIFALLLSIFQVSFADNSITIATAEKIAKNVFFERSFQQTPIDFNNIKITDSRVETVNGEAAFYIFNFDNGGFVIVSADEALPPFIGYDLQGFCPDAGINTNFDSFLDSYSEQVAYIRENNIEAEAAIKQQWNTYTTDNLSLLEVSKDSRAVSPLLINLWNQDSPYNMLCPVDPMGPGGHVLAGCVATAMSMVMHYWRYPMQGTGSHGYSWEQYGYIFADFGEAQYIYNNMQTEMDGDMPDIALLQFHCGVAVDMMYSGSASGAYSFEVPSAIKNHFGYANNANYRSKGDYSNTGWLSLLKDQIDQGQPMYYSGASNSGGHAFVCDGYDDDNFFHYNFGWSGSSNGFYSLYDVGGFSSGQGAVINFIPGGDYPYTYTGQQLLTGKSGSIEDGSGPIENYTADNQVSWLISPQSPEDSITNITLLFKRFDLAEDDELIVYDGASISSSILGTFTGSDIPAALSSTGNELLVALNSNGDQTANGFLMEYTGHSPIWCSGMTILSEATGEISDGSFDFHYDNDAMCKWMISPTNPTPTTMYFNAFDTESGNDKLLIYNFVGMELLAEYSGSYLQGALPDPITSESGQFFIAFVSNNAISGQGFDAYYAPQTVGIDYADEANNDFLMFPNPASQEVNFKLSGNIEGESQLTIYNLSGAKVYDNKLKPGNEFTSLNVADFKAGLYVVILQNGDTFYRKELAIY